MHITTGKTVSLQTCPLKTSWLLCWCSFPHSPPFPQCHNKLLQFCPLALTFSLMKIPLGTFIKNLCDARHHDHHKGWREHITRTLLQLRDELPCCSQKSRKHSNANCNGTLNNRTRSSWLSAAGWASFNVSINNLHEAATFLLPHFYVGQQARGRSLHQWRLSTLGGINGSFCSNNNTWLIQGFFS